MTGDKGPPDYGLERSRRLWRIIAMAAVLIASGACAAPNASPPDQQSSPEASPGVVHWVDGDSGTIDGTPFRLADVDAPETGGVGSRGGAKCADERVLGLAAEVYMKAMTEGRRVVITHQDPERDFSGRIVVNLSVDGKDVGDLGVLADHLQRDPFDNGKRVGQPVDWCKA